MRQEYLDFVLHYEGERGAERKVRKEQTHGVVKHYEGEPGAERKVRTERPSGRVRHYQGERGEERQVRQAQSFRRSLVTRYALDA